MRTYVLYTNTAYMQEIRTQLQRYILSPDEGVYTPMIEQFKRIRGKDRLIQKYMFPGYLFITTPVPDDFYIRVRDNYGRAIFRYCRVLRNNEYVCPIEEQEQQDIFNMCDEDLVMRSSTGLIVGDELVITDGPLKNISGRILRIDRHKRTAALECRFMGDRRVLTVGLEVTERIKGNVQNP